MRKIQLFFTLTLLLMLSCAASAQALFTATVPYKMEYEKFVVKARIGTLEGRFIIDTAAPTTVLKSFASKAGLKGFTKIEFEDSNGQTSMGEGTIIPALGIGCVSFSGVEAAIVGADSPLTQFGVDGIIGYTAFADKILLIDHAQKSISISNNRQVLDLKTEQSLPLIDNPYFLPLFCLPLQNGVQAEFMLDTGASGLLEISIHDYPRLLQENGLSLLKKGYGAASVGAAGLETDGVQYRLAVDSICIGGLSFSKISAETTAGTVSRLGAEVLEYAKIVIDYPKKRIYIMPYPKYQYPICAYYPDWDISITAWDNKLMAGIVWGEELRKIVQPGDQIVSIDAKDYSQVDTNSILRTGIPELRGDTVELELINKKTSQKYKVNIWKR